MATKQSPREESGIVYWYVGNTFDWTFMIAITDDDGAAIDITGDTVTVVFSRASGGVVYTATATVSDGAVTIQIDGTATAKFAPGYYTYRVNITHDEVRTILVDGRAVVE